MAVDLGDAASVAALGRAIAGRYGRLDGLVNNGAVAAGVGGRTFEEIDIEAASRSGREPPTGYRMTGVDVNLPGASATTATFGIAFRPYTTDESAAYDFLQKPVTLKDGNNSFIVMHPVELKPDTTIRWRSRWAARGTARAR